MFEIDDELARAEEEMRAGSLEDAARILLAIKGRLEALPDVPGPAAQERLLSLVKVLNNLGVVEKNRGDLEAASRYLESALEAAASLTRDGVKIRTGILSNLGLLYSRRKMYARSKAFFDEALRLCDTNPDAVEVSFRVRLHNNRALFYVRFGELEKARDELGQALEAARNQECAEGPEREAWLNANLAMIHAELGEEEIYDPARREELFRQARNMFIRSAELYGGAGYLYNKLKQLINVAEIEIRLGALEEARRRLKQARREAERLNSGRLLCEIAQLAVELAVRSGDTQQVIDRLGELIETFKTHNPPDFPSRQAKLENLLRRAGQKEALAMLATFASGQRSDQKVPKTPAG